MRPTTKLLIAAACALGGFAFANLQTCQADLVVFAEFQSGVALSDQTVTPGQTIALDLFGTDVAGATSLVDLGLGSARLRISPGGLQFVGTTADDAFQSVAELNDPGPLNANFIDPIGDLVVISQALSNPDFPVGPLSFPAFPTDGRLKLGTLNVVVPADATGSISFQIEDGSPAGAIGGSVAFGEFLGTGENAVQPYTGTLQVAAVPEPSATMMLFACALSTLLRRRGRRK